MENELMLAEDELTSGAEIRRASAPESPGMCRKQFRHMVEEHARLAERQGAYARDR